MTRRGHKGVDERAAKLLALLTKAAAEDAVCPTNAEMAGLLDLDSSNTASKALLRLETQGAVTVKRFRTSRIVTIASTGKSTAAALPPAHADDAAGTDGQAQGDAALRPRLKPLSADREPCRLCGVRGDIGCRHSRRAAPAFVFVPVSLHSAEVPQL